MCIRDRNAYCIDVSNQLMAADAILRRANREVLSAHLSGCVRQALESGETGQIEQKMEELNSVLEKLSK